MEQYQVRVPQFVEDFDLDISVTQEGLNSLVTPYLKEKLQPCLDDVLKSAEFGVDEITDVLLVGGSTRLRWVREWLTEYFGGIELNDSVNPDEAVAIGATQMSAQLNIMQEQQQPEKILMQDVMPMSLGIYGYQDKMQKIVKKNVSIPFKKSQTFTTTRNNQE